MPSVLELPAAQSGVCRCGTRFACGDGVYGVSDTSPTVATLLNGEMFCSRACVRAWFLETLNELDAIDTPANEMVIVDLRSAFVNLALDFATIVDSGFGNVV